MIQEIVEPICIPKENRISGREYSALIRDELLHELFEAAADNFRDRTAVECGNRLITYEELEERANCLANALRARGVGRGDRVAFLLPRSEDLYIAMLGIMKSGAAYIPLDPETPHERIQFILRDSDAKILVTTSQARRALNEGPTCLYVDTDQAEISQCSSTRLSRGETGASRNDLCYIIYTSGTTGQPKGVLIEHRNAAHLVRAESQQYGIRPEDRIFQLASPAFDASVEEIWMAFFHGLPLIAGTPDIIFSGNDFPMHLERLGVTVLSCVPTFLSMVDRDITTVRLLILGGESCPPGLAERWHRTGRTVINTYGPTETTVVATTSVLMPQRPVTIGRPIANCSVFLLDDRGVPVPRGSTGEICIGGEGVARGYLNRPELDSLKFPSVLVDNKIERVYRTGDLARETPEGELEYLGRADSQVKIRGYRIELEEIEAALAEQPGVLAAAATVHQESQRVAAYMVPHSGAKIERALLRTALSERLPAYMIPAFLDEIAAIPTLASGKVDRKLLPEPHMPLESGRPDAIIGGRTEPERIILRIWSAVLGREDLSPTADFFSDLGGHSMLAAIAVSRLRREPGFSGISLSDLYSHPTAESLAQIRTAPAIEDTDKAFRETSRTSYWACAAGQGVSLFLLAGLYTWQWLGSFLAYGYLIVADHSIPKALLAAGIVELALTPSLLGISIALKWIILGRIRPGTYPLWGWYYFRFWLVRSAIHAAPVHFLAGTPWICVYYRLMGAKIGRNVYFGASGSRRSNGLTTFDIVSVGDGTSVGMDTSLDGSWVEGGCLHIAPVSIGRNCFVGNRCAIGANTVMEDGAGIGDLSMLPDGACVPQGELWTGSPARPAGMLPPEHDTQQPWSATGAVFQGLCILLFPFVPLAAVFPGLMLVAHLGHHDEGYSFLIASPLIGLSLVVMMCMGIGMIKWPLVGRLREGRYPIGRTMHMRKWFFDQIMDMSLEVTESLYTTLYLRPWLKILGARIGRRSEIDAVRFQPDLFVAGEECFLGGDVLIGAPRVRGGWIEYRQVCAGRRLFGGAGSVIPGGTTLGNSVLVGTLSIPPQESNGEVPSDSAWFGSPAINLRTRTEERFPSDRLYRPPARLVALRLFIEFFRMILPLTLFVALASLILNVTDILQDYITFSEWLACLPLLYLAAAVLALFATVMLKYLLIGRFKAGEHPLWSGYVWRSELVSGVYSNLCVTFFLDLVRGTPFIALPLRMLGMKVGKRCYIDSTWFSDFDLVEIGDEAALNDNATPLNQLFEGRVMCTGPIRIGRRCRLGAEASLQYNTEMLPGSALGEMSLLMKGEILPEGSRWHGIPARLVEMGPSPAQKKAAILETIATTQKVP
jgi:non-ribosomal peptide synthetase-like protein